MDEENKTIYSEAPDPEVFEDPDPEVFRVSLATCALLTVVLVVIVGYSDVNSGDECANLLANYLVLTAFDGIAMALISIVYIGANMFDRVRRYHKIAKIVRDLVAMLVAFAWGLIGFLLITEFVEKECREDFGFLFGTTRIWVLVQLVSIPTAFGFWIRDNFRGGSSNLAE